MTSAKIEEAQNILHKIGALAKTSMAISNNKLIVYDKNHNRYDELKRLGYNVIVCKTRDTFNSALIQNNIVALVVNALPEDSDSIDVLNDIKNMSYPKILCSTDEKFILNASFEYSVDDICDSNGSIEELSEKIDGAVYKKMISIH